MKAILLLVTALLVSTNWVFADEAPNLDDPNVREKILKEALLRDSLEKRGPEAPKLLYAPDSQDPYTGWFKNLYDNGKAKALGHCRDGKADGPFVAWHKNGQKEEEVNYKDGQKEGLSIEWRENGEKKQETTFKDGKREAAPGSHFYFVKVTQADGDRLWSAPVWLAAVVSWK